MEGEIGTRVVGVLQIGDQRVGVEDVSVFQLIRIAIEMQSVDRLGLTALHLGERGFVVGGLHSKILGVLVP